MRSLAISLSTAATMGLAALTGASAADMAPRYAKAAPVIDPGYNWSGFYIGGNIGYGWGRARTDGDIAGTQNVSVFRTAGPTLVSSVTTPFAATALSGRTNLDGVIGGGQFGYNWQVGKWVWGLEADFQGSDQHGSGLVCNNTTGCLAANYKLDWFGTARGRVGFLPTDRVLLYATGGLAYGHLGGSVPAAGIGWGSTRAGWTVGAGGEAAIDRNWTVKLEYLYMDLGSAGGGSGTATTVTNALDTPTPAFNTVTTTTATANIGTRFTDHIVRVGFNYRFGGPVVAKY